MKCKIHNCDSVFVESSCEGYMLGAVLVPAHWRCDMCEKERIDKIDFRFLDTVTIILYAAICAFIWGGLL